MENAVYVCISSIGRNHVGLSRITGPGFTFFDQITTGGIYNGNRATGEVSVVAGMRHEILLENKWIAVIRPQSDFNPNFSEFNDLMRGG